MVRKPDTSDGASPGAAVAGVLVALVGVALSFAAVRYAAGDARKLVTGLSSVLGMITGSMLAYRFTRSAVRARSRVGHAGARAGSWPARPKELHNRLTKADGIVSWARNG
jgi:hypothetical protein